MTYERCATKGPTSPLGHLTPQPIPLLTRRGSIEEKLISSALSVIGQYESRATRPRIAAGSVWLRRLMPSAPQAFSALRQGICAGWNRKLEVRSCKWPMTAPWSAIYPQYHFLHGTAEPTALTFPKSKVAGRTFVRSFVVLSTIQKSGAKRRKNAMRKSLLVPALALGVALSGSAFGHSWSAKMTGQSYSANSPSSKPARSAKMSAQLNSGKSSSSNAVDRVEMSGGPHGD